MCSQKLYKKLSGEVWGNSGKNPSQAQNLPTHQPIMKNHPVAPLLKRQWDECPRHASIFRRPCAHYSARTLFTGCCRLQFVTLMNINYRGYPKTK